MLEGNAALESAGLADRKLQVLDGVMCHSMCRFTLRRFYIGDLAPDQTSPAAQAEEEDPAEQREAGASVTAFHEDVQAG